MANDVHHATIPDRIANVFGWFGDGMLVISVVGGIFAGAIVGRNDFNAMMRASQTLEREAMASATGLGLSWTVGIIVAAVVLIWLPCRAMKYIISGR